MGNVTVLPALLQRTSEHLTSIIYFIYSCADGQKNGVHLDVMDNRFVPNFSFGNPIYVSEMRDIKFEVHLMVENPFFQLEQWEGLPNVIRAIFHYEALNESDLRNMPDRFSIALNPATPIAVLGKYLDRLDHVLFMGVKPGWSGQKFDSSILQKIVDFCKVKNPKPTIGADGGVNAETAPLLVDAGVQILNAASFLFESFAINYKFLSSLKTRS